jgi:hypothetical protein
MLPSDAKLTVGRATTSLYEPRAMHWWDDDNVLSKQYAPVLGIEGEAWDIYLLYDKDATWGDAPPKPAYWQEQLGISPETQLDRAKLTAEAKKLLGK